MPWKQHRSFKNKLLVVLFLFINCICTAAPIIRLTDEDQADAISTRLLQVPNPLENEEENHGSTSGYINHVNRVFIHKHCNKHIGDSLIHTSKILFPVIDLPKAPYDNILPTHGNHAFLFLYNLF